MEIPYQERLQQINSDLANHGCEGPSYEGLFLAMRTVGMENDVIARIVNTLNHIDIVWRLIDEYMAVYPDRAEVIYHMFLSFQDVSRIMAEYDIKVFTAHVAEILDRVGRNVNKPEMEMGTDAELLIAMFEISLRTPVHTDAFLIARRMFIEVMQMDPIEVFEKPTDPYAKAPSESWSGAVGEEIIRAKRTLRRDRQVPTKKYLEEQRQEDIKRGNKLAWMKYQKSEVTQLKMI